MSIHVSASPSGHFKLLDESLKIFDENNQHFMLCSSNGHSLKIPVRVKMLSPLLSGILDSLPEISTGKQTIILPDCNHVHAKHLLDLLTEGRTPTNFQEDIQYVKNCIMDVAEILGMDMKNLAYDEQKLTLQEELEDDEIIDDNESRNELTQNIGLRADVKIASFAKADIFNPNVVNNEMANNNSPQFAEKKPCEVTNQFNLKTHMESNHGSKKLNKFGECWTCGKVFDNKLEFCIHTEKHKTCSVCGANLSQGERNRTRVK